LCRRRGGAARRLPGLGYLRVAEIIAKELEAFRDGLPDQARSPTQRSTSAFAN
jgi:hypothetical protein